MRFFSKALGLTKPPSRRPDPTDLDQTLVAACHASCHPDNAGAVIVVVDLGAVIDKVTGDFFAKRYNYWSHHPSANHGTADMDFNNTPHLVAAFLKGRRVDTNEASAQQGGIGRPSLTAPRDKGKKAPEKQASETGEQELGGALDYK